MYTNLRLWNAQFCKHINPDAAIPDDAEHLGYTQGMRASHTLLLLRSPKQRGQNESQWRRHERRYACKRGWVLRLSARNKQSRAWGASPPIACRCHIATQKG